MFKIGDVVQHKVTKTVGRVSGYGCQISDNIHFMTLKVIPFKINYYQNCLEDTVEQWCKGTLEEAQLFPPKFSNLSLVG
ncbi:MAG: hypothetical protein RLZZ04_2570 [Cyanobacteriota bacterium]